MKQDLQVKGNYVKLGNEEYDIVPKESNAAAKIISDMYVKLGMPQDPFSDAGAKLVDIMIAVWEDLYPLDAKTWHDQRKEYKQAELTIGEQVNRGTGRSLASFPFPIYQMMKKVFRGFEPADRANCMKIVAKWPMFQMANKI